MVRKVTETKLEVRFRDLSWPLKMGIVGGFILVVAMIISFLSGLFTGYFYY